MAVKPIIDIEVNDAEFRRFYDLFGAYAAELDEMPEAWRTLGTAMGESTKDLEAGSLGAKEALAVAAAQAGIIAEAIHAAAKATNELDSSANKGAKSMDKLRKGAEGVGKAISAVGGWIVKLGALGGLGAIFSGFGIGELASSAFRRYKAASSVGLSPGQYSSFAVNAQQFLSTSALEAAANAQNDVSKAGYLAALGIRYSTAQSMNASDLAFEQLKRARAAYVQNPALAMQNPAIQSYLALGGSINDVRNAANVPLSQLLAAQNRTRGDAGSLGFSAQTAQAWANLKITLDKAGVSIEADLINKLGPLAPELTKFTQGVIDAAAAFFGGKNFDKVVDEAKQGLSSLAYFVEHTDWKTFGKNASDVATDLGKMVMALDGFMRSPFAKFFYHAAADIPKQIKDLHKTDPILNGTVERWFKGLGKSIAGFVSEPFAKGKALSWITNGSPSVPGSQPINNPLDEKNVGGSWKQFASAEAGIRSNASLLAWYPKGYNADTIAKIIKVWAPESDGNNPNSYASNVEKWSGVPRNLPIGKWTKAQFAAVISAMSREEGTHPVSIQQVIKALYGEDIAAMHRHAKAHPPGHQTVRIVNRSKQRPRPPVHVSVSNATSARVAVSLNAIAPG